jgi:putative Ca2+/H+ antiporter (TMEM165/GDT1 family)
VFGTTLIAFFVAEMGDKTQVATIALAARYHEFIMVVLGTTLGMMLANVPAVLLGERIAHRLPVRLVHGIAAVVFALLGVATLAGVGERFGL